MAGDVDPPRLFLSICALKRLVGETGSSISFTPAREHPRLHRARDSPKLRLPPLLAPQRGGESGASRASSSVRGLCGGEQIGPGVGKKCTDPAAPPVSAPLSRPGSWFANENPRGKSGSWAPHRPSTRGGLLLASRFWSSFWARGFRPWSAPFRSRSRSPPSERRLLHLSLPGRVRGFAGPVCPSRAGPGALPLTPAPRPDASTGVTFIFGAEKFLPLQGSGCEGRKDRPIAV